MAANPNAMASSSRDDHGTNQASASGSDNAPANDYNQAADPLPSTTDGIFQGLMSDDLPVVGPTMNFAGRGPATRVLELAAARRFSSMQTPTPLRQPRGPRAQFLPPGSGFERGFAARSDLERGFAAQGHRSGAERGFAAQRLGFSAHRPGQQAPNQLRPLIASTADTTTTGAIVRTAGPSSTFPPVAVPAAPLTTSSLQYTVDDLRSQMSKYNIVDEQQATGSMTVGTTERLGRGTTDHATVTACNIHGGNDLGSTSVSTSANVHPQPGDNIGFGQGMGGHTRYQGSIELGNTGRPGVENFLQSVNRGRTAPSTSGYSPTATIGGQNLSPLATGALLAPAPTPAPAASSPTILVQRFDDNMAVGNAIERDWSPDPDRLAPAIFPRGLTYQAPTRGPRFHPMQAVMASGPSASLVPARRRADDTDGEDGVFSANYQGERTLRNASANIPDELNCSLWITNLPADVTYTELLGQIRGMGRVFATVINPPDQRHETSAAKVVFFERDAAHAFYVHANRMGFSVGGRAARVSWNRIKSREQEDSREKSRVVVLCGLTTVVNADDLILFFRARFKFDIDEVIVHNQTEEWTKIEVRFGSYRCQAEAAKMAITRELLPVGQTWDVRFGTDPCEVSTTDMAAIEDIYRDQH